VTLRRNSPRQSEREEKLAVQEELAGKRELGSSPAYLSTVDVALHGVDEPR
jgi:hypothetical protein